MGTNWNIGGSVSTSRNTFLQPLSTGTGYPGRLWTLHPRRYSKAVWTWSWATCSSCPCLSRGGSTRWPPVVPSNLNHPINFCNSVSWANLEIDLGTAQPQSNGTGNPLLCASAPKLFVEQFIHSFFCYFQGTTGSYLIDSMTSWEANILILIYT